MKLDDRFLSALQRHNGRNFDGLSETDRTLVTIWGIEAEVNNGGFGQYYANEAGDLAFHAPRALEAIGATRMAEISATANAVFGPAGPPRDWDERRRQLTALTVTISNPWDIQDREFQNYPDDIRGLLLEFIENEARLE